MEAPKQVQSKVAMILICFFLGGIGIHRYMMGYSNWWLMLITAGGCGIWSIYDLIMIIVDKMPMADGRPLDG
jgi:TM2 domain-containing membrane protein YozV